MVYIKPQAADTKEHLAQTYIKRAASSTNKAALRRF